MKAIRAVMKQHTQASLRMACSSSRKVIMVCNGVLKARSVWFRDRVGAANTTQDVCVLIEPQCDDVNYKAYAEVQYEIYNVNQLLNNISTRFWTSLWTIFDTIL